MNRAAIRQIIVSSKRKWLLWLGAALSAFVLISFALVRSGPKQPSDLAIARACLDLNFRSMASQTNSIVIQQSDDPRLSEQLRALRPTMVYITTNRVIVLRHATIGILSTEYTLWQDADNPSLWALFKWIPFFGHRQLLTLTNN